MVNFFFRLVELESEIVDERKDKLGICVDWSHTSIDPISSAPH